MTLRAVLSGVGQLLVTVGVVVALYLVYLLSWTGVVARQAAARDVCALRRTWAASRSVPPEPGVAFATLRIPRIRNPLTWPVLDGVQQHELRQGIGWYPGTQLPGQAGNFAVAAHRRTWGDMFRYLDEVRTGDTIVVQDGNTVYTYRVIRDPVYVPPTALDVLHSVPGRSGLSVQGRYITLTTCDPVYDSYRRLIVFGRLESARTHLIVRSC